MKFHRLDPNFRIVKDGLSWFSQLLRFLLLGPPSDYCHSWSFVGGPLSFLPALPGYAHSFHGFICHLHVDAFQICAVLSPRLQVCNPLCVAYLLLPPTFAQTFLLGYQVCIMMGLYLGKAYFFSSQFHLLALSSNPQTPLLLNPPHSLSHQFLPILSPKYFLTIC